ncbi:MAG: hypothetical protein WKF59_03590 [Chitinophagaceae bacterium]
MSDYLNSYRLQRRDYLAGSEIENPNFDINKNDLHDKGNRVISNLGFTYDPS